MKIGINALFYQYPASGSGQYLSHLLHALSEVDSRNEYILFGPRLLPQNSSLPQTTFPYQVQSVPSFAARNENIAKVVWEQWTGPAAARKTGVDIFHVPHFAPPLVPRTPTVVTIHDVIPLRLPLYRAGTRVAAYIRLVARAAHCATLIITVSQHAKQDMIDALKLPAERIRVIYEAAGEEYRPITNPAVLKAARKRYGVGERYIFYLGGLDQRKNVQQLVRAFARVYSQLDDPNLQLLIAGNPDKQRGPLFPDPRPVAADLGMSGQIVYRFIEEEDKAAMYSGASLFVFPSLYEGFGLDPLEAMSCGAPVVCSNRTSLPEVVGDAAITIDPENLPALVDAMRRVLSDDTLRADLRVRSLKQAAKFSWRKTAEQTLIAYEEVYARSKK
ncbi:MAG TPA: glycosyltransferase family 1 protein [Ktedonobacteraceae bacterium]|nr:glycosyltransferase family 1 protein [Ktedonobacteraceae bacterium]